MPLIDEFPFRAAVGTVWLINFIVRIIFQSRTKGAKIDFSTHERGAKLYFRLFAFSYLLLLVYIFSTLFDFAHITLVSEVRWIAGGGFLITYMILFVWTHAALGKNWSGLIEIHSDHQLIVTGPFRYIRHPMYASFILSGIGFLILSANWLVGGIYLLIAVAMYLDRVEPEELMMKAHFGTEYMDYMQRTGRLFPRLRS